MNHFECTSCGYVYSPETLAVLPVQFEETPDDWKCPACQCPKTGFRKLGQDYVSAKERFKQKGKCKMISKNA